MTTPVSRSGSTGSWWGVLLVLAVIILSAATITAIWRMSLLAQPTAVDSVMPLSNGVTLTYRVRMDDGSVHYQSWNVERLQGAGILTELDASTLFGVLQALGLSLGQDTDLVKSALLNSTLIRTTSVEFGHDKPSRYSSLYVLLPQSLLLVSSGPLIVDTPVPTLDLTLPAGQSRQVKGTFLTGQAFTAATTMEAREAVDTALGRFSDCVRERDELSIGADSSQQITWYCPGIGQVRYVMSVNGQVTAQGEVIAASAPGIVLSAESIPAVGSGEAGPQSIFEQERAWPLVLDWKFQSPSLHKGIMTPPVVMGRRLIYGTEGGAIVAVNRDTQKVEWSLQTGGGIYGAPVVSQGILFAGSADRRLYALDAETGAFLWAFETRDIISAAPVVSDGTVYVGSEDRNLYALDARTGKLRWSFSTGGIISHAPTVGPNAVYVGSDDGNLYALDRATGAPRWAWNEGSGISTAPVVANGIVYAGAQDQHVVALKADTTNKAGEEAWTFARGAAIPGSLTVAGDAVYVIGESDVRRLDAATGTSRWLYHQPDEVTGGGLLLGNSLYLSAGSNIVALDALKGTVFLTQPTASSRIPAGVSSDGAEIFVPHSNGLLEVYRGKQP